MKKLLLASAMLFVPFLAMAEFDGNQAAEWRAVIYDGVDFSAEADGAEVYMEWTEFDGRNDEQLEWYKVLRSTSNDNPVYPDDEVIKVSSPDDLKHTDWSPKRGAYYRVCGITDNKGRYCSNVVWVEAEFEEKVNFKETEDFEKKKYKLKPPVKTKEHIKAQEKEWQERYEAKKQAMKEKEAAYKEELMYEKEAKKQAYKEKKTVHENEKMTKLYGRLEQWLDKLYNRFEQSDMTNAQKIEKVMNLQNKLYEWEKDNELRMKVVAFLDQAFEAWIKEWNSGTEVEEIDQFLEGLFEE